ncbi:MULTISPECIES: DUF1905 domain-containing protein [Chryseobacterium]|uniref:DUF1905 domain-containing protein n=1 Tax=Chryseobacterium camelliae TaxID=1265445 RepID=A0ABU0TFM3_9FLAO|nr:MULTISPECIES: DUF1905 domain-containing protein [Chryseobacterium]MDT3406341.1 hypothetical protein [Pseudacidovorax intermedius]MDQ1095860.1 hypothetical protein [Chryseobacterium camelliae]MDQ1099796.1 hypothetical protein [Chryseobacterium sp. SORGH_AS_1048]MDR6087143.1 hypothetical protein [Chryseobacterium sp. SORGH_AS_0909]MDR6131516.1 hypothetical protein [Chryseobacterium sp. SORGH_AS_1175]
MLSIPCSIFVSASTNDEKEKTLVDKTAVLEKFQGKGGWTFVRIPEVEPGKDTPFGWVRVCGTVDGCEIRSYHLQPMGSGLLFLPVKSEIRKKIKKREGDTVHITLYEDQAPAEIPDETILIIRIKKI